jgi:plastocyanin
MMCTATDTRRSGKSQRSLRFVVGMRAQGSELVDNPGRLMFKIGTLSATLAVLAAGGFLLVRGAEARQDPQAAQLTTSSLAAHQVQMRDFSYSPNAITNTVNDPITITVTNAGPSAHTFTITGVADSGSVAAGQTRTVQFTPMQAGDLTFFCTLHGQAAMSGRISVTNPATSPVQPSQQQPAPPPAQQPPAQQPPAPPRPVIMQPPSTGDAGLLSLATN